MNKYQIYSFAELLESVADERLTHDFAAFVGRLEAHASEHETTAKGSFGVTVSVRIDEKGEVFVVVDAAKVKTPAPPVAAVRLYADVNEDGETVLSRRDPKQRELFEQN